MMFTEMSENASGERMALRPLKKINYTIAFSVKRHDSVLSQGAKTLRDNAEGNRLFTWISSGYFTL